MRDMGRPGMLIRFGYRMTIECAGPTPVVCMTDVHDDRRGDLTAPAGMTIEPDVAQTVHKDLFGNTCRRFLAPAGLVTVSSDGVIRDSGLIDDADWDAPEVPVDRLPAEAMPFLAGSRYCETDVMSQAAWDLFGGLAPGYGRVQAIVDFGKQNVRFDYNQARSTRTAHQTLGDGVGVCRDYAHLAITFCRALNIPARYVNGYLGDIGVPVQPFPMDFSAWMEVWLGDRWYTFDPRNNARRIGRIVIARGRDAADVPMIGSFGPHLLREFTVWTDEVEQAAAHVQI